MTKRTKIKAEIKGDNMIKTLTRDHNKHTGKPTHIIFVSEDSGCIAGGMW